MKVVKVIVFVGVLAVAYDYGQYLKEKNEYIGYAMFPPYIEWVKSKYFGR